MSIEKRLTGVLFDWDGTLLDSYHADAQAYLAMFRAVGLNWGLKELEEHYSPDWYTVYRKAGIPEERWDEADSLWRAHYALPNWSAGLGECCNVWRAGTR